MDPLSITASVIAVAGAAGTASKCARAFYKIARKAGAVREDVEFFASHIDTFGSIVSSVHNTIRDHYMKYRGSLTLQRLGQQASLKNLALQSNHLMRRLKDLEPDVKDRDVGLGFLGRARWLLKGAEREELCVWMERVKMAFVMIMYEVMYEALQERVFSQDSLPQGLFNLEREMREHKKQMKRHMKTMRVWSDRHENFGHGRSQRFGEGHGLVLNKVEKMVLDMGQSMISQRASTSSSIISAASGGRLSDDASDYEARGNVSPVIIVRRRNSPVHRPLPQLSPSQRLNPALHQPATPPDREETHTRELPFPSTLDDPPQHWNEGDYMAVQPSDNVLYLDADLNSEAITGYINSNSNSTVAKLNQEFSQNVISEQRAAQLSLQVEYHNEGEEGMEIDFGGSNGNGRQPVLGKVTFVWKKGQKRNLRPLKVTCLVCEYLPFPLIFGQLFLKRRRYYWEE